MPTGPKGEKRPADAIGLAVMVGRIATGEVEDVTDDGKDQAAKSLGKKGGKASASKMTDEQKRTRAKAGAEARWRK